ncbi:MAG: alanine racemase, partial [Clostridiaceae bacterium]|nr:alanine racemase [Clostridiaceae bacterium]
VNKTTSLIAVVKADAYGHGALGVIPTLIENGVGTRAVSILDEAIQLRKAGITIPVLVMNYTDPARAEEIIEYSLTQAVYCHNLAEALSRTAVRLGKQAKIHIKIDTGMARVGFQPGYKAVKDIAQINNLSGIIIEGLFTHFASADEVRREYTNPQYERFKSVVKELNKMGIMIPVKHIANSAAIIQYPDMCLDMVRPGIILYGLYPSKDIDRSLIELKPAMRLLSKVSFVKEIDAGVPVSYGRIYETKRKSIIATIPVGYADGYSRLLSNCGRVLIHGQFAPVVGRVCMDQFLVDVTDIPGVKTGDEAVLIGRQGNNEITADEVAELTGTINYEVVCLVGKRVPRVYIKDGRVINIANYLI